MLIVSTTCDRVAALVEPGMCIAVTRLTMRRIVLISVACLFAARVAFGQGAIAPTQTTAPPPATATATGSTTGTQAAGQQDPCSRQVVIYIDLSGTMTQPAPNQRDPNLVPLNFIASTLLKFVSNQQFLRPGDEVSLKYFGTYVVTKSGNREEIIALLEQLAGGGWRNVAMSDRDRFLLKSDFHNLFDDIKKVVPNSTAAQQIVFIASDFAEDPTNVVGRNTPADRVASFGSALAILKPLLDTTTRGRKAQVVGIAAPTPQNESDRQVSDQVRQLLRQENVRTYDFNEDAEEAARTLWNTFIEPIRASPADGPTVRVSADQNISMRLENPNCAEVQITGLQFTGSEKTVEIAFTDPVRLSNGRTDARVSADRLSSLWNSEVDVTAILAPGSTARAIASARFWLGDWIRISRPEAHAYPRSLSGGDLLVTALVEKSLRGPSLITIRGAESGGRGSDFVISRGYTNEPVTFRFPMESSRGEAFRTGLPLTISAEGIRLSEGDAAPATQLSLPVPTPVTSGVMKWLERLQGITTVMVVYLIFAIVAGRASQRGDEKGRRVASSILRRLLPLIVPVTTTSLLAIKFGYVPGVDNWIAGVAIIRSLLAALGTHVVISQLFFQGGLWRLLEPKLIENDEAVFKRTFAHILVWVLTLAAFLSIAQAFWGPLASAPPSISRLLTGALR